MACLPRAPVNWSPKPISELAWDWTYEGDGTIADHARSPRLGMLDRLSRQGRLHHTHRGLLQDGLRSSPVSSCGLDRMCWWPRVIDRWIGISSF